MTVPPSVKPGQWQTEICRAESLREVIKIARSQRNYRRRVFEYPQKQSARSVQFIYFTGCDDDICRVGQPNNIQIRGPALSEGGDDGF
jgi:hypothetical protein